MNLTFTIIITLLLARNDSIFKKRAHLNLYNTVSTNSKTMALADTLLEIWTYGAKEPDEQNRIKSIVAKKYGFQFKAVAGCEVTEGLVADTNQHNNIVELEIEKRFGKDWKYRFHEEVEEFTKASQQAQKIVSKLRIVSQLKRSLEKDHYWVWFQVDQTNEKNIYHVKVYSSGYSSTNIAEGNTVYYIISVNVKDKIAVMISDKKKKMES